MTWRCTARVHHVDVKFLWDLLRELPAGEVAAGRTDLATADALHLSRLIDDVPSTPATRDLAESLRPFYPTTCASTASAGQADRPP